MKMTDMQEPFMTTIFTLSSHHPFQIPEQYKDVFPEGELPIHKCIRYTDHALREFFRAASQEPWFKNTVFILIGDHVNKSNHEEYKRGMNMFSSSLIIYSPSGDITPGMRDGIAQHTDIYPTMLNYLGYDKPYMAFGCDLLSTPADQTWAVNYLDGIYQYAKNGYVLQFDGEKSIGFYELTDYLMAHNLVEQRSEQQQQMEQEVKAIIQQYMMRMLENRLVPEGKEADK
jgi:phosphoglycerol transferase MdoB-like AlkP superfamily enzyme